MFNIGDEVYLKSGGPVMTVSRVTNDGYVECVWYSETLAHYSNNLFEPEMLALQEDDVEDLDSFYEEMDEGAAAALERAEADALYRKLTRGY